MTNNTAQIRPSTRTNAMAVMLANFSNVVLHIDDFAPHWREDIMAAAESYVENQADCVLRDAGRAYTSAQELLHIDYVYSLLTAYDAELAADEEDMLDQLTLCDTSELKSTALLDAAHNLKESDLTEDECPLAHYGAEIAIDDTTIYDDIKCLDVVLERIDDAVYERIDALKIPLSAARFESDFAAWLAGWIGLPCGYDYSIDKDALAKLETVFADLRDVCAHISPYDIAHDYLAAK